MKQIHNWLRKLLLHPPISAWGIWSTGNIDRICGLQNGNRTIHRQTNSRSV